MTNRIAVRIGALAVCLAGCARIDAPKGYVPLKEPIGYDFKAVSAKGNAFALSVHDDPAGRQGDLAFWTQAVEHQKVDLDKYRLQGREEIKTRGGVTGTLFDLRSGSGAGEYTYVVALFVAPGKIYTVEAGGPSEQIKADLPAIRDAISSLRP